MTSRDCQGGLGCQKNNALCRRNLPNYPYGDYLLWRRSLHGGWEIATPPDKPPVARDDMIGGSLLERNERSNVDFLAITKVVNPV
jgi:hypothetical protein